MCWWFTETTLPLVVRRWHCEVQSAVQSSLGLDLTPLKTDTSQNWCL